MENYKIIFIGFVAIIVLISILLRRNSEKNSTTIQQKLELFNDNVNSTESSVVNLLTAFAPWLAPLAPAYMTYKHMIDFLEFDWWLALVLAAVVEILGFGTISTGIDFWLHNRKSTKKKQAPLTLVVISFTFYLVLILASNVVIDIASEFDVFEKDLEVAIIIVRALLTLETVPAALIVGTRIGYRNLLRNIKNEQNEKIEKKRTELNVEKNSIPSATQLGELTYPTAKRYFTKDDIIFILANEKQQIAERFRIASLKTAQNWKTYAARDYSNGKFSEKFDKNKEING